MRYQKKPVVISAWKVSDLLHAAANEWNALPTTIDAAYDRGDVIFGRDFVTVNTLEGSMRGGKDDWIICGIAGELYPCKPDIFEASYTAIGGIPVDPSAKVLDEINDERLRQRAKGYDAAHDDGHDTGGLAAVAAALVDNTGAAARASGVDDEEGEMGGLYAYIMRKHYADRRRQLVIAAALLVAEVERLDRAAKPEETP